jgi:hypothetical protein
MRNRQLLEESEQLIFRSAVSIWETDMLIERSQRLLFNKDDEKLRAATNEVVAVGNTGALPTEYVPPGLSERGTDGYPATNSRG